MDIAFTICSNNYLAHAKTLGDSFLAHHPDAKFIIGLVDRHNETFDYSFFSKFEIIPVEELNIIGFEELKNKYNITELNTAVKPSYFHHIFKKYSASKVIYIDPDILVASRFEEVIQVLDQKNIVITPHMCSPTDDELSPTDYHVLGGGIFNLGFIALSNYTAITSFLDWWHRRVVKYGFADQTKGMFYDQLWINYVPAFYDNYYILRHVGYNMANWNLHERKLNVEKGQYFVNARYPLRFFHFSGYNFNNPNTICRYHTRFTLETRGDIKALFEQYQKALLGNGVLEISKSPVFFYPSLKRTKLSKVRSIGMKIYSRLKKTVKMLIMGRL